MGRQLWLPDAFRDAGLPVSVIPGWETRGAATFNPAWLVEHHTASRCCANSPALGIVVNGIPGKIPGPLANWHTARDGHITVVASGKANHAGTGRYPDGTYGNTRSFGNEAENNGVGEPWGGQQKENIEIAAAAVCRHMGWGADRVIGHKEYTTRKIDPTYSMPQHRAAVALKIGGAPPPSEEDDMLKLMRGSGPAVYSTDFVTKSHISSPAALAAIQFAVAASGGDATVHQVPDVLLDTLPTNIDNGAAAAMIVAAISAKIDALDVNVAIDTEAITAAVNEAVEGITGASASAVADELHARLAQ